MIELVPLLQIQRNIYDLPRSLERFRTYIDTLTDEHGDMELPLSGMNPMGHEHNAQVMDALIAMDAEGVAERAVAEANQRLGSHHKLRVALVVVDDLRGQWTNRYFTEASHRFDTRATDRRGWATVCCWTSEMWTPEQIYQETLAAIYRTVYVIQSGYAKRLSDMLIQEGLVMRFAGMTPPPLEPDDLAYSREIIEPLLASEDFPTQFGVLYGDEATRSAGYQPIGLSERAGFAVAFAMAMEIEGMPEARLGVPSRPQENE